MKEGSKIARSAGLVSLLTLLSRILGLVRDAVVAALFHKRATDAFFVAYTIPNVLRRLLAEGALTTAFIPVFTKTLEQEGKPRAQQMLSNMLGSLLLVLCLVTAAGVLLAPWLVKMFAYGLTDMPDKYDLAVYLTRIMFVFLLTVGLTALAMGALNTMRQFNVPAMAPVVLNIFIIGTVWAGHGVMDSLGLPGITALALGVVLGGMGQNALQLPFLRREGLLVRPRLGLTDPGVLRVGQLMVPAVFGMAIHEVNIILARQFASFLPEGSISYIYYAQRLVEFPMGIIAVAVATVAMPSLSSFAAAGRLDQLKETYRYALGVVLFVILPASAGLAALGVPLTSVLFQRGRFDHAASVQTALTLLGFLAGLWAGAGVRQTVPVFHSLQDTKTPVKVAGVALVVYTCVALLLYRPLGTLGLALSVACSSMANFLTLLLLLRRRLGRLGLKTLVSSVARSVVASAGCAAAAWWVARAGDWEAGGQAPLNYVVLLGGVVAGAAVYVVLCKLLRVPELDELLRAFQRRR